MTRKAPKKTGAHQKKLDILAPTCAVYELRYLCLQHEMQVPRGGRQYEICTDDAELVLRNERYLGDQVFSNVIYNQGSFPVYSNKIAVSVVDNVLLVHQVDAKVVIIYDIFADSQGPVSAPLPLLVRGFSRSNAAASQLMGQNVEGLEGKDPNHGETVIYGDEWVFLVPDLICDIANGVLWKIHLDLEAISSSSSEVQAILEFLQRKLEANKQYPDDLCCFVFASVEEEMAGDASYLVAIIVEFLRSANLERLKVPTNIYVLMIQLLARNENYAELGMFSTNKIIEPSKEVAMQLLASGSHNFQTRKLSLHMLRELALHHDFVLLLVQDGYYLEALRYARKTKVNTIQPSLFFEAAYASNDPQHLAAVLRFFSDFIPGVQKHY
ncbi:hypothetical protein BC332_07857 [Capsicum chinense]|nr:hypothetical protein BC332_07857 [Capsicum chinense]